MTNPPPGGRKAQILDTLAGMLDQDYAGRVTTAALAARLGISEAALYRHFSGKAAIFDALIDLAQAQIRQDLAHIDATEPDARKRLRKHLSALLLFSQRHPGLAKVLTGHALEDAPQQRHANAVIAGIQAHLARGAQEALAGRADADTASRALTHWVAGCWQRRAQGGDEARSTAASDDELAFLGL